MSAVLSTITGSTSGNTRASSALEYYTKVGKNNCIVRESNPGRIELVLVSGNDPGYHYPNNAFY